MRPRLGMLAAGRRCLARARVRVRGRVWGVRVRVRVRARVWGFGLGLGVGVEAAWRGEAEDGVARLEVEVRVRGHLVHGGHLVGVRVGVGVGVGVGVEVGVRSHLVTLSLKPKPDLALVALAPRDHAQALVVVD